MADIDCIMFDLSEVLMDGIKNLADAIETALKEKGFSADNLNEQITADLLKAKDDVEFGLVSLFVGKSSEKDFFSNFLRLGDYPLLVEDMMKLTRENFKEYEHSRALLEKLKSQGYPLALLSDHAREWIEYIEPKSSFMEFFDQRVYSFDSGHVKKEPKAFEYALKKAGAAAEKTLFIDDLQPNLEVAKEAGIINVLHYTGYDDLVKAFAELGIRGF